MPTQQAVRYSTLTGPDSLALSKLAKAYGVAAIVDALAAELETWRGTFENDRDFQAEISKDVRALDRAKGTILAGYLAVTKGREASAALLSDIARSGVVRGDSLEYPENIRHLRELAADFREGR